MYVLTTLSNYPAIVIPYYNESPVYLIYFIPFVVFTVLILLPIPVAVIFEAYRINRSKILLQDRLEQKESLFLAFVILDNDKRGYIDLTQWNSLISEVFNGKQDEKKVK
jgi:hypothetical protein